MSSRRAYKILWFVLIPIVLALLVVARVLVTGNQGTVFFWALIVSTGVLGLLRGISDLGLLTHKRLERDFKQCQKFCAAIRNATRSLELQEMLDETTKIVVDVLGVKGCSIKLLDPKSAKMQIKSITGMAQDASETVEDISDNIYNRGLISGEPIVVKDVLMKDFPEVNGEIESMICVPLRIREKILGAICVYLNVAKNL